MRAARLLLVPLVLAGSSLAVLPAPAGAVASGARPAAATAVHAAMLPARASRTNKRGATRGRYCPVLGASLGDGFGVPRSGHLHQGIDLMIGKGRRIFAVESGYVVREGRQRNGALRIVLQGRKAKYYYGHNSKDLVRAGQRIKAGQVIALTGDSGAPGTPHLHFEYWPSGRESAAVNPLPLVRLLCF